MSSTFALAAKEGTCSRSSAPDDMPALPLKELSLRRLVMTRDGLAKRSTVALDAARTIRSPSD